MIEYFARSARPDHRSITMARSYAELVSPKRHDHYKETRNAQQDHGKLLDDFYRGAIGETCFGLQILENWGLPACAPDLTPRARGRFDPDITMRVGRHIKRFWCKICAGKNDSNGMTESSWVVQNQDPLDYFDYAVLMRYWNWTTTSKDPRESVSVAAILPREQLPPLREMKLLHLRDNKRALYENDIPLPWWKNEAVHHLPIPWWKSEAIIQDSIRDFVESIRRLR